jgi:uncharacterized protein YybS (DUF2232 family)
MDNLAIYTNPLYTKPMNPNPYYKEHDDFAFVLLIPLIIAAVGAGAAITTTAINASNAKRAAAAQQDLIAKQLQAQEELVKIQATAALAVQEQKAKNNQTFMIYGIIALVVIVVAYFMIRRH